MDLTVLEKTDDRFNIINGKEAGVVDHINDSLMWGAMNWLRENGFTWVEVPILTKITGACENVDTLYSVDHFNEEAYLAQTGQLYLEAKIPMHQKLWTIITSSRAEDSVDERHLNQFQLIELEHQGDFEELLTHVEGCVKGMLSEAVSNSEKELRQLKRLDEVKGWLKEPFGRLSYTDVVQMLIGTDHQIAWGEDLKTAQETYVVDRMGGIPVFITHFPKEIKFFNMRQNDSREDVVNSCDLIMPYSGESVGAAERENDHGRLVSRLETSQMFRMLSARGKTLEDFKDYLELVRKHPVLHSGCGIGFTRISQSVLGSGDIRTACNFPLQRDVLY